MEAIGRLIKYIVETLPNEVRQDVLWRHAILSRQVGQFIGVAITHHPKLTPDARPMSGLDDASADLLAQTFYTLISAGIDVEKVSEIALKRMQNREWAKVEIHNIDDKPTGIIASSWKGRLPYYGVVVNGMDHNVWESFDANIILIDHLENDDIPKLQTIFEKKKDILVLTRNGGMTSHAANVCREFGIPCVVGLGPINIDNGSIIIVTADNLSQRAYIELH